MLCFLALVTAVGTLRTSSHIGRHPLKASKIARPWPLFPFVFYSLLPPRRAANIRSRGTSLISILRFWCVLEACRAEPDNLSRFCSSDPCGKRLLWTRSFVARRKRLPLVISLAHWCGPGLVPSFLGPSRLIPWAGAREPSAAPGFRVGVEGLACRPFFAAPPETTDLRSTRDRPASSAT